MLLISGRKGIRPVCKQKSDVGIPVVVGDLAGARCKWSARVL